MSPDQGEHEVNDGICTSESEDTVTKGTLLTTEEAERYVADPDSVDLSEYASIEDAAAAVLSKHSGELCLDGVTHISAAALLALSQHRGRVSFASLVDIDEAQAAALAGFLSEVDVPVKECKPNIQSILLKHPSSRIRDNDPEFHNWLLDELGFDDDEDSGRDWVSDEVMRVLLDVCACEQSADSENGVEMRGSGLKDVLAAVRAAGAREIHTVELIDRDNSVFMFVGTLEEIKSLLQPAIAIKQKKKPIEDEDEDEDELEED